MIDEDEKDQLQDGITDTLLLVHREEGLPGVLKFLRMAVANYAAECWLPADATDNEKAGCDPDPDVLRRLADAIVTLAYLHERE